MHQPHAVLEQSAREEIDSLHVFFEDWFSGRCTKGSFTEEFSTRFNPDFKLIPPAGTLLNLEQLSSAIRNSYATNPVFHIQIRNVTLQRVFADHMLVTYEEWQRNALASTSPNNGRIASVIFKISQPLEWLHIHETWLPEAIQLADKYDF